MYSKGAVFGCSRIRNVQAARRLVLSALLLICGAVQGHASTFAAFGPKTYVRSTGSPVTVTDSFTVLNPATGYTLKAFNGGLENTQTELVSSSVVTINGIEVIGSSNFNQNVSEVDVPVVLQSSNTISVQVRGQPGGTLAIEIVGVDNDPPTIKAAISPTPNPAGWNTTNVTVTFVCSDATSGVASCPQAQAISADGAGQIISGTAKDNAGNAATSSVTVNLDKTPPSIQVGISPAANPAGWNDTNVTITFTCADSTSGVRSCPQPETVSTQGAGQTISGTVTDIAGNTASTSITANLDKTLPTIQASSSPSPNAAGWNNSTVTVTFVCADTISGIASCPQPQTVSSDGPNQVASGTATDLAGNVATASLNRNLDQTPPTVTATVSPRPNAAGWNNTNPTVTFVCADSTSGISACPASQTITNEVIGLKVSGTATDIAGNTAQGSATVNLDKTSPVLSIQSPANGATLPVGTTSASITGNVTDSISGVASVSCNTVQASVSTGAFACLVPLVAGTNAISVQAIDFAGNSSSASTSLTVSTVTAPQIAITSPANLTVTNLSPATVSGTVSDPSATLTINGMAIAQNEGFFSSSVPLVEGVNVVSVVGTTVNGFSGTATVDITLDTTPPHLSIDSPANGSVTTAPSITVSGSVNDIVPGTVNDQDAQVTVNGIQAQVANRSYLAMNVPLLLGANAIQVIAKDRAGNQTTTSATVTQLSSAQPPAPGIGQAVVTNSLNAVSGNNQTGPISSQLPGPLMVKLTDVSGHPVSGQSVVFKVTGNDGILSSGALTGSSLTVAGDANGIAQAFWTLGTRSGTGLNRVEVTSATAIAPAEFNAIAVQGAPAQIVIDSGENQTGTAGQPLTFPFGVVVTDAGHNRVANVPVTFTAISGNGTLNGAPSEVVATDSDGRALAILALGPEAGISNNAVEATFAGNTSSPVAFIASAKLAGDPAQTTISGVVLDNTNQPIPNSTIRLFQPDQAASNNLPIQIGTPVLTDAQGHFTIQNAPVGFYKLMADGNTAGNFPSLEYDLTTIPGQDNNVGTPIYLPVLNGNQVCVDEIHGGTLTLPQYPGFSLTIAPGSATFPGGSRTGCVSVSTVHGDKVPMAPGFGQQPRFIVTIQPVGTMFNPPAAMTLPNVDGLKPRAKTEMYSYDHDLGMFVSIGTATVSDDGSLISSDAGTGVLKAGWHCGGNPNANGHVADCGTCKICAGNICLPDVRAQGKPCDSRAADFDLSYNGGADKVRVTVGPSCQNVCNGGQCVPQPSGFSVAAIKQALDQALQKIFDNSNSFCIEAGFRQAIQAKLKQFPVLVGCQPQDPASPSACAQEMSVNSNNMTLFPLALNCGEPLAAVMFHELIHGFGDDPGAPDVQYHNAQTFGVDCRDRVYGCEALCFNTGYGNGIACARTPDQILQKINAGQGSDVGCGTCSALRNFCPTQ